MKTLRPGWLFGLLRLFALVALGAIQGRLGVLAQTAAGLPAKFVFGDYDAEIRRPDGHVDIGTMLTRLKDLGVNTYYWLVWHAPTDWDDLQVFLPQAAQAGISVAVYLVPPSESPPVYGSKYSEPYRLDYGRWAEEIARLSLANTNLTSWVIDDFYANALFTPGYVQQMQARAKAINPRLAFTPMMYFPEITPTFANSYYQWIDGVIVAYPQNLGEIRQARAVLSDAYNTTPNVLSCPARTLTRPGDYVVALQSAKVLPSDHYTVSFSEKDDYTGSAAGYHFKQFMVDGVVAWEKDVAGGTSSWQQVSIDISEQTLGKTNLTLGFRLVDRKAVSNFAVRWSLHNLAADGLQPQADLSEPEKWQVGSQGALAAGFGDAIRGLGRYRLPFLVMETGDTSTFRSQHGDPVTPDRIHQFFSTSFSAWQAGLCDGVVTYCLEKSPQSKFYSRARKMFWSYQGRGDMLKQK
jgi:hypothetical protein